MLKCWFPMKYTIDQKMHTYACAFWYLALKTISSEKYFWLLLVNWYSMWILNPKLPHPGLKWTQLLGFPIYYIRMIIMHISCYDSISSPSIFLFPSLLLQKCWKLLNLRKKNTEFIILSSSYRKIRRTEEYQMPINLVNWSLLP